MFGSTSQGRLWRGRIQSLCNGPHPRSLQDRSSILGTHQAPGSQPGTWHLWHTRWRAVRAGKKRTSSCQATPRKYVFDVTSVDQRKYVSDVTSVDQRKYVSDVTSIGQLSSPWTCSLGKSTTKTSTSSASSIFLVHNLCCDKCIERAYLTVSRVSIVFHGWVLTFNKREYELWKLPLNSVAIDSSNPSRGDRTT